jgi:hypothetical protein
MIVLVSTISMTVVCVTLLIYAIQRNREVRTNEQRQLSPSQTLMSPRVIWWRAAWLISLTVLCLSIIGYGWLHPRALFLTVVPSPAFVSPEYLQGYNVGCGVLIWLVFRSTLGRHQGGVKSVVSLLAISGAVLATVIISNREGSIAMEEIQRHVSSLTSSGGETNSNVARARGEFGEIECFFKTRLSQMASLPKAYERERAAIGWETVLDPESLGRDPTLMMSSSIVRKAKETVTKYRSWTYDLCENSKKAVWDLPISGWAKQYMVNDLVQVLEELHAGLDERWSWEAQIIAVVEQVIAWLSSRPNAWSVENGVLVFANESDLSRFNAYMSQLNQLTSQQDVDDSESPGMTQELKQLRY